MKNSTLSQSRPKARVCLVFSSPSAQVGESVSIRLKDLIRLIEPCVDEVYVITNRSDSQDAPVPGAHFLGSVACPDAGAPILSVILGELGAQVKTARNLMSVPRSVDTVLWRGRSSTFLLPLLVARLRRMKSMLLIEGRGSDLVGKVYGGPGGIGALLLSRVYSVLERMTYYLSDRLLVVVPGLLQQSWVAKYGSKVFPHPISISFANPEFTVSRDFESRAAVVGYVGRMSKEKGVLDLLKAVSTVSAEMSEVQFLFAGDGPLLRQVETELADLVSGGRARVLGWIPHDQLPRYLNEMRLLVMPSRYEGLPATVLESMACGTPVLATGVGAVPDIVKDGETGFIIGDLSPERIAEDIVRALGHPDLARIGQNGTALIDREYRCEVLQERYRELLAAPQP